jgi:hypothetical protein
MTDVNWIGYRWLAWLSAAGLAAGIVVLGVRSEWIGAAVLGGFLLASALILAFERRLPAAYAALLVLAALVNACGWAFDLYQRIVAYDEIGHALGTLGATLPVVWYGYRAVLPALGRHRLALALTFVSMGIALGAVWEIAEWCGYYLFQHDRLSTLDDELSDLVCDTLGALMTIPLAFWALPADSQHPADSPRV